MMNPALAASGSGGLAGALVVIVNGLAAHFFGAIVDPAFIAAEVTLATAAFGVGAHFLTRVVPPASPAQ